MSIKPTPDQYADMYEFVHQSQPGLLCDLGMCVNPNCPDGCGAWGLSGERSWSV